MSTQKEQVRKINRLNRKEKIRAMTVFFGITPKQAREELRDMGE